MPRLIPRLLERLEHAPRSRRIPVEPIRRRRKLSLRRPLLPLPSLSPHYRTRSILLDEVNPIINASAYKRHKSLPPKVWIHDFPRRKTVVADEHDRLRRMTEEERKWWASPYLRMLSSPPRNCMVTFRTLPKDFLVRLAPMRLPSSGGGESLVPDGVEHPKYKSRRSYIGTHIICWKDASQQLADRGRHKRLSPKLSVHSLLSDHVAHLLRVRVLQELELLADSLQSRPQGSEDTTLVRRLTMAEWNIIKSKGVIPYNNAVAVVVVPPLNRDPTTKIRPKASVDAAAIQQDISTDHHASPYPLPPLSTLYPITKPSYYDNLPNYLPSSKVPLYNGVSLFPSRSQRAALHARLTRLVSIERRARYREHRSKKSATPQSIEPRDKSAKGNQKASHAFLLLSDEKTVLRADTVATAIALWRVRMWEGAGWEEFGGGRSGWEFRSPQ